MTAEELLADPGPVKLAAYRNAIIEECARVAEDNGGGPDSPIAFAIRKLKKGPIPSYR